MNARATRILRLESPTTQLRVVGTQGRQKLIWAIVGPPTQGGDSRADWRGEAALEPEPENPHDPSAVRVLIGGDHVGYLERAVAAQLQPALAALASRGVAVVTPCFAKGGFEWREGGRASVGLALELDPADVLAAAKST
jgi:hypothetical protein